VPKSPREYCGKGNGQKNGGRKMPCSYLFASIFLPFRLEAEDGPQWSIAAKPKPNFHHEAREDHEEDQSSWS
jgi:hypothetical protein